MVRLVISDNEGSTTVVPLVRDEITIGRKEGNTIRLTERNISRQHAQLVRENGVYKLRDLDSYNGVLVNGQRVQGESQVQTGDQIQIGDYTILVEEEAVKALSSAEEPTTVLQRPVMPARLVMLNEPTPGAEVSLPEDRSVRLGRAEDIDCPINHRSVSREHAQVKREHADYIILDLGSANGVSVNGQPVEQHTLKSGDILELGQVVFRYVAPGEHYVFDAAEEARYKRGFARGRSFDPKVAVAVLASALVVAIVVVKSRSSEPSLEIVTPLEASSEGTSDVGAASTLADDGYDKAVRACRSALSGARFAEALAHAALALKVRPDAAEAGACKTEAQTQHEEEQAYVRGRSAFEAGDVEAAYKEFSRLGASSRFRGKPEVAAATEQLARVRLSRAGVLLGSHRAEAARLAQSVLLLEGLPEPLAHAAEALLAEARKEPEQPPSPSVVRVAVAKPRSGAAPREPVVRVQSSGAASSGLTPMDAASACLAKGDNDCVIRALVGKANSAQELGLLIETYRAVGDTKQAQKNMISYVKRFPTARRADTYRRMLELQAQ